MQTKTFNEIIADGYTYPSIIPESLQDTIQEWFGLRHVVSNENFKRFFDRVLLRDYNRYNEQLRIEAGNGIGMTAGFDWLVNMYMEKESVTDTHNESSKSSTDTMTGTVTDVSTPRATTSKNSTETRTYNSGESITHGHIVDFEPLSKRISKRGDSQVEDTVHDKTANFADANSTSTAKAAPASVIGTYSDGISGDITYNGDTPPDPFASVGSTTAWDSELSSPTAISKDVQHSAGESASTKTMLREEHQLFADEVYGTGKDTTTNRGTDSTSKTGSDTIQFAEAETKNGEDTLLKTYNTQNSVNGTDESDGASRLREIYTGRGGENMAAALTKAREYIQTTNAWEWLSGRLETCFMAVYDI